MNENSSSALLAQYQGWRSTFSSGSSARETAYQIIRNKIINMEYKPGEPISDKKLAEELDISRTPVREAIILLTTANMVVLRPQIGTFVSPINTEWIEMERFSRYVMEKEILTQACRKADRETAWAYEQNLREYEHYYESQEENRAARLLQIDNEFHGIAFRAVGRQNSFFQMMDNMQHFERLRILSQEILHKEDRKLNDDHSKIAEAVLQGDEKKAVELIEAHLSLYQEDLKLIRQRHPEYF